MYLPIVDLRMVTLITDVDDKLIGVGISMPLSCCSKSHTAVVAPRMVLSAESFVYETPRQNARSVARGSKAGVSEQRC